MRLLSSVEETRPLVLLCCLRLGSWLATAMILYLVVELSPGAVVASRPKAVGQEAATSREQPLLLRGLRQGRACGWPTPGQAMRQPASNAPPGLVLRRWRQQQHQQQLEQLQNYPPAERNWQTRAPGQSNQSQQRQPQRPQLCSHCCLHQHCCRLWACRSGDPGVVALLLFLPLLRGALPDSYFCFCVCSCCGVPCFSCCDFACHLVVGLCRDDFCFCSFF